MATYAQLNPGKEVYSPSSGSSYTPPTASGFQRTDPNGLNYRPSLNIASQISTANKTSGGTSTSPVVSSKTAQTDYTNKLATYQAALDAMKQQTDLNQQRQAQMALDKAQKDLTASETNLKQQGIDIQKTQADAAKTVADAKLAAANGLNASANNGLTPPATGPGSINDPNVQAGLNPPGQTPPNTPPQTGITPSTDTQNYTQGLLDVQDERTSALNSFLQTANTLIIGMQASESALVSATTQQFQNIMKAQEQSNASELGAATEAAARSGQEYTPGQAASTIANVINQGNQRLSDINSKMASTIAELDMNFAKEQYTLMNDNFDKLDKNFTERMNTFKDVHDAVAADAKTQMDAQKDARDFAYKQKQDTILNNLNSAKFTYQQKQDAIDNAFKSKQINEAQRHNLAMEAIAKDPTPADKKKTEEALKNAQSSIPIMQDKIATVDNLKNAPGLASRVGPNLLTRKPTGILETIGKGLVSPMVKDSLTDLTGQGQDFAAGVHQLVNGLTLQNLIDAKARGATFGALSEGELGLLATSASKISGWETAPNSGVWNIDENSFKKELDNIKTLTNRALVLSKQNIIDPEEQKQLDSAFPTSEDPSIYYSNQ